MLTRSEAKKVVDGVFSATKAKDVRVTVSERRSGNTRFADNQPTTNGDVESLDVAVTVALDGRSATVTGSQSDAASLARLARDAEELARLAPVDPEAMPPLSPCKYVKVRGRDGRTAGLGPVERAKLVEQCISVGKGRGLVTSGFLEHEEHAFAIANRAGLFAHHVGTTVSLATTSRTADGTGSGRAAAASHRVADLDATALSRRAADKAEASRDPRPSAPGDHTVVLEPAAVAELLGFMLRALSARAADEGRSYFSAPGGGARLGEKLFKPEIRLWSDPGNPDFPSTPIGEGGVPREKTSWIEDGVLRTMIRDRYWAKKTGKPNVPGPGSLFLGGGTGTAADLVAKVERGILVTRFWYTRMLEPKTIMITGLTRDGTFAIDKGKVVHALKNLRFNESPLTLLKNAVAMGTPERAASGNLVVVVPPLVVTGFHFESTSDAV